MYVESGAGWCLEGSIMRKVSTGKTKTDFDRYSCVSLDLTCAVLRLFLIKSGTLSVNLK